MTLRDLIDLFRFDSGDRVEPYFAPDTVATAWANEGQVEACRRSRLITDSTGECSIISIPAGKRVVPLDQRVIFVRRMRLASRSLPVPKIRLADLEQLRPDWEDEAAGETIAYCEDYQTGAVALIPPPVANDTMRLTVIREPLAAMTEDDDVPEIESRFHPALVQWMLWRYFSKPDAQTEDPDKAKKALALFESEFGVRSSAKDEKWIVERHGYDDTEGLY